MQNNNVLKTPDSPAAIKEVQLLERRWLSNYAFEIELTRPLNKGIHQTGNPVDGTTIMISVYGSPIRRLYINRFDYKANKVERLYPPRIKKKMLALQALKNLTEVQGSGLKGS